MISPNLLQYISPPISVSTPTPKSYASRTRINCLISHDKSRNITVGTSPQVPLFNAVWSNNLISLAIAVALIAPLPSPAIPSISSNSFSPSSPTPFSQARNLPTGLDNGKIRPCPSINPGCISSNPMSSNFAFPWRIDGYSSNSAAIQQLRDTILKTQKNVKIQLVEDTPTGKYLEAEVDGGFSRDVMEFLVNGDVVSFRAMATKVTYIYPFTTALGNSKGQEERLKQIVNELGWYAPSFDSME